jgi:predicted nucleotidyltransferase
MRKNRLERIIQQMVLRIVERFDPERIILFGSAARGDATRDSDVDLLVVMPVEGPKHKKQVQIRVALHDIRIPKDIIVTTPEDFEWRKEIPGTIEYPAVHEGKVLYARG